MKVASAQIESDIGSIQSNLDKHFEMIELASQNNVDLIVFPEMSITGYCREEGEEFAMKKSDYRIHGLIKSSIENNLIIIAGAPVRIDEKLFIGSFVFNPSGEVEIYTKQFLHEGEELFYDSSFDFNPVIKIKEDVVALAICADINNVQHPENARLNSCTIYVSSIFFSRKGIVEGHQRLSKYASEKSFVVLMSNFCGKQWNIESGGRSAFWNKNGELLAGLDSNNAGLLTAERKGDIWETELF